MPIASPRIPAPLTRYDRENEAVFRLAVERALDQLRNQGVETVAEAAAQAAVDTLGESTLIGTIGVTFDGGGSVITAGAECDLRVPYRATITKVTMLADQAGSIVIDVWKDRYTNFPPTDADSITGASPPTISGDDQSETVNLSGWTTVVTDLDCLRFHVDSASAITRCVLMLTVEKS